MSDLTILKKFQIMGILTFGMFCLEAAADDVDDVNVTTQKWATAFNHKSTEEIVALYADDAVFFCTSSPVIRDNRELITEYFSGFANLGDINMVIGEHRVQIYGDIAISTGYYTMTTNDDGESTDSNARFTFAYAKREGEWVIVEHHSSAVP